jgi:carboxymethylenebutenolidase
MSMMDFDALDGRRVRGYFAQSGQDKAGVVVLQEWWGLNDQIMGVADRLARAGYNALAPDLYNGRVTTKPDEAHHLMNGLDLKGALHLDIRGALRHLRNFGSKAGIVGYCMGGVLAIAAAVEAPEADCAICFYGIPDPEMVDLQKIKAPFQGHFANEDHWCTPEKVDRLTIALQTVTTRHEVYRYAAQHGFANERSEAYNTKASELGWERLLRFLIENIG